MSLYKKMYVLTEDEYKLFKQMCSEPVPTAPSPIQHVKPKLNEAVQCPEEPTVPSRKRSMSAIKKTPRAANKHVKKTKHVKKYPNWLTL